MLFKSVCAATVEEIVDTLNFQPSQGLEVVFEALDDFVVFEVLGIAAQFDPNIIDVIVRVVILASNKAGL